MKRRSITALLGTTLAAVSLAAVSAPAEVLENLAFFSDMEILLNLELLEEDNAPAPELHVSTAPALSTATLAAVVSTTSVKGSTSTRRAYEKN